MLELTERILFRAYILALLLGILTIVGSPLHRLGTHHADISRVLPDHSIVVETDPIGLSVGDPVAVYRFNPGWTREIGFATIERVSETGFEASFEPETFHWPMGSQGTVLSQEGGRVDLSVGSELGLARGQTLHVFRDRSVTGKVRIDSASDGHAVGRVVSGTASVGSVATPFTVANQVSWFYSPGIQRAEATLLLGVLALWLWGIISPVPGRAIARVRKRLLDAPLPEPARLGALALLGLPVVPALTQFSWYTLAHLTRLISGWVRARPTVLTPWDDTALVAGYAVGTVLWLVVLFRTRRNPVRVLWESLRFRPPKYTLVAVLTPGQTTWLLHLAVFYAFGSTLTSFLQGNVRTMLQIGWSDADLTVQTIPDLLPALAHIVTHVPSVMDLGEAFALARLSLWTFTICGCLLGYGHTLLSILWKPAPIRNIDFTPVGWAANAICYGPLLGAVAYRMTGGSSGLDPGISGGLWWYLQMVSELLLNLLYTLSIWNLGTRFGVMVDKGVQERGFYSFVRHPSYTLEGWMFIVYGLSSTTTPLHYLVALAWPLKYFIRSERDDAFMGASNPDYVAYREKVRWKFYPGLW